MLAKIGASDIEQILWVQAMTDKPLNLNCTRCQKVGYFLPEGLCWPCQLALNPETPDRPLPDDCKTLQLDECVTYGSSLWYVAELPRFDRENGRWWIRISPTHSSQRKDGDWAGVPLGKITRNLENELEDQLEQLKAENARLKRQVGGQQAAARRAQQPPAAALDRVVELESELERLKIQARRYAYERDLAKRERDTAEASYEQARVEFGNLHGQLEIEQKRLRILADLMGGDELVHDVRTVVTDEPHAREWNPLVLRMAHAIYSSRHALSAPPEAFNV
jgi:hypothetical protein